MLRVKDKGQQQETCGVGVSDEPLKPYTWSHGE